MHHIASHPSTQQETPPEWMSSITFMLVHVTPEKAATWLDETNTANRKLTETRVVRLVDDIKADDWRVTPDMIAFDDKMRLLNGQHRLTAIKRANRSVWAWVMYNVPTSSFEVTDTGKPRSLGDALGIRGVPQASNVAALVAQIDKHMRTGTLFGGYARAGSAQMAHLVDELGVDRLVECVRQAHRVQEVTFGNRTGLAFAFWLIRELDVDQALDFEKAVADDRDGPAALLRDTFLRDRAQTHSVVTNNAGFTAAYTIKAWNAWVMGEELRLLKYRAGGARPESFPVPVLP